MSLTRKAPTAAKGDGKPTRHDLAQALAERDAELAEARRQQAATAEILRVISQTPTDPQPVFERIVATAARALRCDLAVALVREGDVYVHTAAATQEGLMKVFAPERFPIDASVNFPSRAFLGRTMLHLPDWSQIDLPEQERYIHEKFGIACALYWPLLRGDECIGVLVFAGRRANSFGPSEIAHAESFRDQAVIAINNVGLFNETQESLQQQKATADVLKVINRSAFDLDPVFDALLSSAVSLVGGTGGTICVRDHDVFRYRAVTEGRDSAIWRYISEHPATPGRASVAGRVLLSGKPETISDTLSDRELKAPLHSLTGARSVVGVPLLRDHRVDGALMVARAEAGPFDARQIDVLQTFADQAVIAIENVRLFNETQEALRQQTATSDILKVIASSPNDLQPVLDKIVETACHLCSAYDAVVLLREGDQLRVVAHYGPIPVTFASQAISRDLLAGRAVIERQAIHIDDIANHTDEYPVAVALASRGAAAGLEGMLWRANLVVPLLREGEAVGTIGLRRAEPVAFSEGEIELLKTFADQAVIAIENVRLFDEVRAKTRDLEESLEQQTASAEILRVISSSTRDVRPVFETIVRTARKLCDAERASVHILRDGAYHAIAVDGRPESAHDQSLVDHPILPGRGSITGRVVEQRSVVHVHDVEADPEFTFLRADGFEFRRTMLGVPLLRDGQVIGVIVLQRSVVQPFTKTHIDLVTTFADQAVIAIENARLFDEVQARTRDLEESLQQQTATADVLKVISRSAFDLQTVLDTLASSAAGLIGADFAVMYLRRDDAIRAEATFGCAPELVQYLADHPQKPGRKTLAGRVFMSGEVHNLPDVLADPEYDFGAAPKVGNFRALLGAPMFRDGRVEGSFTLGRREPGPFTERQISIVQTFADQAVIAIENVRLFDEVQAKTRDLEEALQQQTATADVLKVISRSAFDLDTVLKTLADSARSLSGATGVLVLLRDGAVARLRAESGCTPQHREYVAAHPFRPGRETVTGRVLITGEAVHIPDVLADPDYEYGVGPQVGNYRATFGAPLIRNGVVDGVFTLLRPEPGAFTPRQIELVRTFADQAVIAIENARLFDEVQAKTRDLEESLTQQTATADVLKAISRTAFDLDTVLETLITTALRLCDATYGEIFRRHGDVYRYAASRMDVDPAYLHHERAVEIAPSRETLVGRVALENRTVEITDAWNDPEYAEKEEARIGNVRAMLGVPLMRDGEMIGAFALGRADPISFTQRQVELVTTFADQAVIAIENARLFDEVQAKTRDLEESLQQQTATAEVLKVISRSTFDLNAVLTILVQSARDLCNAPQCMLFLRESGLYCCAMQVGWPPEVEQYFRDNPIPPGPYSGVGRAAITGQVAHFPDVLADPDYRLSGHQSRALYRTLLSVPLLREEEVIGVFSLCRPKPDPFTEREIELVKTFADQAVIAIENVRLFDEVQAKTRDLEESLQQQTATADVLKVISRSAFDLPAVLRTLVESAAKLCDADKATITREVNGVYYRAESYGFSDEFMDQIRNIPVAPERGSITGLAMLEGKAIQVEDVEVDPDYWPKNFAKPGELRTGLGIPMMRNGAAIGVLALMRTEVRPFNAKQIELVQTFADQAVIAIENARLFDEVQAKTRDLEEALQQQTATAGVLKVISRSAFDLQAVLTTLAESARDLCGASFVTLSLRDGGEMRLRAESGCTPEIVQFLRAHPIKAGRETFTGRVMLSGEAVHLPDVLADPEYDFGDAPRIGNYRTLLGVPLLRDGQVEGVFALARPEPAPFAARQIEMVRAFADQAVIAIENSRLFEEVQARTRELAASLDDLRKAQDRLIQSEKLASLGQLTAGIAHEIKNPLNFINNYSALSRELVDELAQTIEAGVVNETARGEADELIGAIGGNLDKVVQHGKRADSIVKNMLLHSREGSGERSLTDVNAMVEEALNLAYHGARAEKPGFNVTIMKSLDPKAGAAEVYAQEMTRVLLNLISNGFYATSKRKQSTGDCAYEPTISASTRDLGPKVEIAIRDNGTGIPNEVKAKMFNPFFTTKPAGEGTGLGLSLSHDIVVKQHGGAIEVLTEPGAFTEFTIVLPRGAAGP